MIRRKIMASVGVALLVTALSAGLTILIVWAIVKIVVANV